MKKDWAMIIKKQKDWGTIALQESKGFEINDNLDYDNIAEMLKDIKVRIKKVKSYWKPLKDNAYKQWKDINSKEKELLKAFSDAEIDIKEKMAEWQKKKLEEERLIKEEAEQARKDEEKRLLKISQEESKKGNIEHAKYIQKTAHEEISKEIKLPKKHKTEGTSKKVIWKARVTDIDKVPAKVLGMIVRPVDMSVLNKIAQMSKGQCEIEGIVFYEDIQIIVRT